MTGFWTAVLLGLSALLLLPPSGSTAARLPGAGKQRTEQRREQAGSSQVRSAPFWFLRARSDPMLQELPLLIHQLTGLLAAGRAPHQLWADAAALQRGSSGISSGSTSSPAANGPLAARLLPVLEAAAQAASLGLSPAPVFRAAAGTGTMTWAGARWIRPAPRSRAAPHGPPGAVTGGAGGSHLSLEGMWLELAACVSVSEHSGAPLAGVLSRYAAALEGNLDQQAARETALAGPQATVRLLTWLPAGGLGLGYLLGANPVAVLAGSPLGWLAAGGGLGLSLAGRIWSRALVRRAAAP